MQHNEFALDILAQMHCCGQAIVFTFQLIMIAGMHNMQGLQDHAHIAASHAMQVTTCCVLLCEVNATYTTWLLKLLTS
jgi:hypothetical protein